MSSGDGRLRAGAGPAQPFPGRRIAGQGTATTGPEAGRSAARERPASASQAAAWPAGCRNSGSPQKVAVTGMSRWARSDVAAPVSATATVPRSRLVAARVRMASSLCVRLQRVWDGRPAHPRRPGGGDGDDPPRGRPVRPWRCREIRTAGGRVPDAARVTTGQRRPSMSRQAEPGSGAYRPAPGPGAVRSSRARRDRDRALRVAQSHRPDGDPVLVDRPRPESQRRVAVEQIADEPHPAANRTNQHQFATFESLDRTLDAPSCGVKTVLSPGRQRRVR